MLARRLLATFLLIGSIAAGQQPQTLPAARANSGITLDGRLDEPFWQDASAVTLTQQSPRPGAPTPFTTTVRIVATNDRLIVGIACAEPVPQNISVRTMRRDGDMDGDDSVSIVLDAFGDRRTGYFFRVNAAGVRMDGLISDPESASLDWDGVWDARTARSAGGWSAEIEIPTRTLNFKRGLDAWSVNFERFVAAERTRLRWASPSLDSFLYDLSRAGSVTGLAHLEHGRGLELSPYLTGRSTGFFNGAGRAWQGSGGFDATWKVTPQLVSVLTVNTDFAETEVDARQINLTRFPLFFPEKRAFFLEGANEFNFGLGLGSQFIPFFSRRIGLVGGQQVPINAGGKLLGRVGGWNVALLDVQTRETRLGSALLPGTNLFAGRISRDVTPKLRLGTIITHGDPTTLRSNTLAGVDAVWRTSTFGGDKNFMVGAWTARSFGDLRPGNPNAWGWKVDYPNDLWDCQSQMQQFGRALNPALGFLPRPARRKLGSSCSFKPRPARDGRFRWIRQHYFEASFEHVTDATGRTESWELFTTPINMELESGDGVELEWMSQFQYLAAPFEIAPGVIIPPGEYQFYRWGVEVGTASHRQWQFGWETWLGGFYDGDLSSWEHYLRWTSREGKLQLQLEAEHNFAHLPVGNFVTRLWQLQAAYAWNPNLVLTSFVQYDNDSHNLGANTRLRWTVKPGNDIFVVWNRGWERRDLRPRELTLSPNSEQFAIKVRWTFRS